MIEEEAVWLEGLLGHIEANGSRLSDWERGFMTDQRIRYEEHGEHMRLSPKQWTIVARVAQKLGYDAPPTQEAEAF